MATNHFGPFLLTGLLLPQLAAGRGRPRRHGLLAGAPGGPLRPARRPAARRRATTAAGRRTPAPSWPTCSSPTSWTGGPAGPGCRHRAGRAPRASPAPTSSPTAGSAGRPAAVPRSSTPRSRALSSQTPDAGAWPTLMAATADLPGSTFCGPSGLGGAARPARRRDQQPARPTTRPPSAGCGSSASAPPASATPEPGPGPGPARPTVATYAEPSRVSTGAASPAVRRPPRARCAPRRRCDRCARRARRGTRTRRPTSCAAW